MVISQNKQNSSLFSYKNKQQKKLTIVQLQNNMIMNIKYQTATREPKNSNFEKQLVWEESTEVTEGVVITPRTNRCWRRNTWFMFKRILKNSTELKELESMKSSCNIRYNIWDAIVPNIASYIALTMLMVHVLWYMVLTCRLCTPLRFVYRSFFKEVPTVLTFLPEK